MTLSSIIVPPWAKLSAIVAPIVLILALLIALCATRGTLERVKLEHKAAIAAVERDAAKAAADDANRLAAATDSYAMRLTAREPIILRSKDTVNTYAQTPAGRVSCLGAERVRGIDELDATLFTPPAASGRAGAVPADAGAPATGRGDDQRG